MKWWHYLIGAGMAGAIVLGGLEATSTPDNEKLVAPAADIVSATDIPAQPSFDYFDKNKQATTTIPATPEIIRYQYKNKSLPALKDEDLSQRTEAQMVFYKSDGTTEVAIDAGAERVSDSNGAWWTLGTATTTKASYDKQVAPAQTVSFLYHLIVPRAYAQTFLTTGAGSGNQTWNVPSDWNSSSNSIECIGAGGDGGNADGAGGSGGEYRKITNLTLTPSGTATYSVGAHASTTASKIYAETYFNGTASSTASLSCSPGKLGGSNGVSATTTGASNGTGATHFNGGDGGRNNFGPNGAAGGGGAAGPSGVGAGGSCGGCNSNSGGGGGGANNGSAGQQSPDGSAGGNGGNGGGGTGGGAGGLSGLAGTNGTAGTGGGGGGAGAGGGPGGNGAIDQAFDSTHGAGAGGGGGGSGTGGGGNGGTYGGGAGGGGYGSGVGGVGGQGIIVITYTPGATTPTGNASLYINDGGFYVKDGGLYLKN